MPSTETTLRVIAHALRSHPASAENLPPVARAEVLLKASAYELTPDDYLRVLHLNEANAAEREADHVARYGEPSVSLTSALGSIILEVGE